jgi:hypothetical protein
MEGKAMAKWTPVPSMFACSGMLTVSLSGSSSLYSSTGIVTPGSVVDNDQKPILPVLLDGHGNRVCIEDGKFKLTVNDGTGPVEYTIPDDIEQLKEKIVHLEKVFNDKFVFSGNGEEKEEELI